MHAHTVLWIQTHNHQPARPGLCFCSTPNANLLKVLSKLFLILQSPMPLSLREAPDTVHKEQDFNKHQSPWHLGLGLPIPQDKSDDSLCVN